MSNVKVKSEAPVKTVNTAGLDPSAIYTATGKLARAAHNADRHVAYNGKSVQELLANRLLATADIKYDLAKGFITLEEE